MHGSLLVTMKVLNSYKRTIENTGRGQEMSGKLEMELCIEPHEVQDCQWHVRTVTFLSLPCIHEVDSQKQK